MQDLPEAGQRDRTAEDIEDGLLHAEKIIGNLDRQLPPKNGVH